ncbi:MAG: hypothetical protein WAO74_01820 [Polaribacter sp.]|uniref:toxin-antitoxin system YwqK family antitoxin n=1 Tax=Polaribacter sp. TaxID=1920175 RepID=UPI003BB1E045
MKKYFFFKNTTIYILMICILLFACNKSKINSPNKIAKKLDYNVNISLVPNDTIFFSDKNASYKNGLYYYNNKLFSGIIYKVQKGYNVKTYSSVLEGKLHGIYQSFFESGNPFEVRLYRNNLAIGKHYGYWEESGNLKFEYNYFDEKKEGIQKNWYKNGQPFKEYNYKNDNLDGMQKSWRLNGSLYRNFEVKNGRKYGLQKTKQCNSLEDEKFKQST